VETGERCDDDNLIDGDGCDSNCTFTGCGNGITTAGEQCDDGNTRNGDCCSATCQIDPDAAPCDDAVFCNGADRCSRGICSVHAGDPCSTPCSSTCQEGARSCADPPGTPCDDRNECTLNDGCDGAGTCVGRTFTGNYAVLRWGESPILARLGLGSQVIGDICVETIDALGSSHIEGDAVARKVQGTAMTFAHVQGNVPEVTGQCVTAGGSIVGQTQCDGAKDTTADSPRLLECAAARCTANARRQELIALPVTPGFSLGSVTLGIGQMEQIGPLPAGRVVIETSKIRLGHSATLMLVGSQETAQVIIRDSGELRLARAAAIVLDGLEANQVLIMVDGVVLARQSATINGTVFASSSVQMGTGTFTNGALLSDAAIRILKSATINLRPFVGW